MAEIADYALVDWPTVITYLKLEDTPEEEAYYALLINAASNIANKTAKRHLKAKDYDEVLDGSGIDTLVMPGYPVITITKLYVDTARVFGIDTEVTDYLIYEKSGVLALINSVFPAERQCVKVQFNAGYAAGNVPYDLQVAILETIAWNQKRFSSGTIGVKSMNAGDGIDTSMELTIPVNAQRVFESYRG